MINIAAIMASQTAMRVSSQFACQQMRKRQKEELERKKKEEKK